jgi:hypothetical protein
MKKPMQMVFRLIIVSVVVFVLHSCTQNNTCLTPKSVALRAGFYKTINDTTTKDSLLTNANIIADKSAQFYGINFKQSSKFSMTLSGLSNTTRLFFQSDSASFDPSTFDTIDVNYTSQLNFISVACGYENYFTLSSLQSTHHIIDTVKLSQSLVDGDVNKEHIQIVLKN